MKWFNGNRSAFMWKEKKASFRHDQFNPYPANVENMVIY
jgi:hypothetical protein